MPTSRNDGRRRHVEAPGHDPLPSEAAADCGVYRSVRDPADGGPPEHWACPACDAPQDRFPQAGGESPEAAGRDLRDRLREAYRAAGEEAMNDLPISHPGLSVDALPPARWRDGWLAVLVTPWCLVLVYLPRGAGGEADGDPDDPEDDHGGDWSAFRVGDEVLLPFPAGDFRFVKARHHRLGPMMSCSLVSPMDMFADQAAALATAREIVAALARPLQPEPARAVSRRAFLGRDRGAR